MVKDEADIIEATVGHMLEQVDHVLIADNGSTDGTKEILLDLGAEVIDDPDPAYYQSRKVSALAERARQAGATWVAPFDADEVWLPRTGTIRTTLESLPDEAHVAEAMVFDHVANGEPLSPWRRTEAVPLRKVAVRAIEGVVIHQGNHGATFPGVRTPLAVTGQLEVRHFAIRSAEQMIRKARNGAAAYAASDLPEDIGAHWRGWGRLSDDQLREVYATYYSAESATDVVYDPCPLAPVA